MIEWIALVAILAGFSVALLALAGMWLWGQRAEKHLVGVLDRFLSRNIQDFAMTDMTRREITADQDEEQGEDVSEDALFDKFLADRQAAVEALGSSEAVS